MMIGSLDERPCVTKNLNIHGFHQHAEEFGNLEYYGSDAIKILELSKEFSLNSESIHPKLALTTAQIVWAVRHEMARNIEDVLARRSRCLLLNAQASIEAAPEVAKIMARELNQDSSWIAEQVQLYTDLASGYLIS